MTFPHAQAIMVLLEQLYRIFMIKKCSGYHH
jgi:23S rRNA pseudoU1915 N3-methylase RlmH